MNQPTVFGERTPRSSHQLALLLLWVQMDRIRGDHTVKITPADIDRHIAGLTRDELVGTLGATSDFLARMMLDATEADPRQFLAQELGHPFPSL